MKKAFLLLLLVLSMVLLLASCKGESTLCLHEWEQRTSEEYLVTEAVCGNAATYNSVCKKCGELGNLFTAGELGEHSYREVVSAEYCISAATCTERAVYYVSCELCGVSGEATFSAGELLDHTKAQNLTTDTLISRPTCISPATYHYSCDVCGTMLDDVFEFGPKNIHVDTHGDYMCDFCSLPLKLWDDIPTDDMADIDRFD